MLLVNKYWKLRLGVLTYSSVNHAQGLALAGKLLNMPIIIVMPKNVP